MAALDIFPYWMGNRPLNCLCEGKLDRHMRMKGLMIFKLNGKHFEGLSKIVFKWICYDLYDAPIETPTTSSEQRMFINKIHLPNRIFTYLRRHIIGTIQCEISDMTTTTSYWHFLPFGHHRITSKHIRNTK